MTASKLYNKYKADLLKLQMSCTHKRSKWMDEYWAPAHSTGNRVRVCYKCQAVIDRRDNPSLIFKPNETVTFL